MPPCGVHERPRGVPLGRRGTLDRRLVQDMDERRCGDSCLLGGGKGSREKGVDKICRNIVRQA